MLLLVGLLEYNLSHLLSVRREVLDVLYQQNVYPKTLMKKLIQL